MSLILCALLAASDPWVVVRDGDRYSMHGDVEDIQEARQLVQRFGPGFLWFRQGGKEYVVRDAKVIGEIEDAMRPQQELGSDQSKLGARQSDLGRQQSKIGRRQSEIGQEMGRRGMRGEHVDRAMQDEMNELSKAQETLGREQEKIGREQERMGKEQERLSKLVEQKVAGLIDASLKDGTALEVK